MTELGAPPPPAVAPAGTGGFVPAGLPAWPAPARYGLAVLCCVLAFGVASLLERLGDGFTLFAPFILAIMVTVWFGGTGPGVFSLVLSSLVVDYFFFTPLHSFAINASEIPSFIAFVASAALASWLSDARRRAEKLLRESRDILEARVKERTVELTRLNDTLEAEIRERRRAEGAMLEARGELARVTRITTVGELTGSIAHEINQPLAAVVANGEAALRWIDRDPPEAPEARQAIRRAVEEGHRASQIVARIRGLVRKAPPARTMVDLNGLIGETVALCQYELELKHVGLSLRLAPSLPVILGDKVQLQQVLLNLIVNALEAMDPVVDRPRELAISSGLQDPRETVVSVADSGIGFDESRADRLFSPFFTTKPDGMGIGLSIGRSIVESHGGRLEALRRAPHGSIFRFFLPLRPPA